MMNAAVVAVLLLGVVICQSAAQLQSTPPHTVREIEAVRLSGGRHEREGRLEVLSNGIWGTVCDDVFTNNAATVVCRSLGFQSSHSMVVRNSIFGEGTDPILLDNVRCNGTEASLNECRTLPIGVHNCVHREDVGVACDAETVTDVRLVNGTTPQEGRLEVQLFGIWGTVCDDIWFAREARVVCRQLGFPTANATTLSMTPFGRGQGPIVLDQLVCNGYEANLGQCSYGLRYPCTINESIGVRCG